MKLSDFPVRKWELKPEFIQMKGKYIHNGFSNMTLVNIRGVDDNLTYNSVENYYQAHKVLDITLRQQVAQTNPYEAKRWAKTITPHEDWNNGLDIMYEALCLKWKQPNWVPKLNSLPNEIVEWNNWRDSKWGVHISLPPIHSVVEGRNILGCMLMQIRKSI